jgi:glycosyltransferase involved in cell wall biosynthesis
VTPPELLTIVMPVYNEHATLRRAVQRLLDTSFALPVEILLVDDGSVDGGLETVVDFEAEGRIRIIRHTKNQGKGAAVRTGINDAAGDLLTIMDADLEYDPADYQQLLAPIIAGDTKVAYGARSFGGHTAYSFWHVIGNYGVSFIASLFFNTWLHDLETCLKVAPTALWRSADLRSSGFGMEAEITGKFLRAGERIFEAPISYKARGREEGKKLTWLDGVAAVWILGRVRVTGR